MNSEKLAEGWCWWYPKYALNNRELKRLESVARDGKRGFVGRSLPRPGVGVEIEKPVSGTWRAASASPSIASYYLPIAYRMMDTLTTLQ